MKTTINISDSVLQRSKQLASQEHITLKAFVEDALQQAIARKEIQGQSPVEPITFGGEGLGDEYAARGWPAVFEAIYNDR